MAGEIMSTERPSTITVSHHLTIDPHKHFVAKTDAGVYGLEALFLGCAMMFVGLMSHKIIIIYHPLNHEDYPISMSCCALLVNIGNLLAIVGFIITLISLFLF